MYSTWDDQELGAIYRVSARGGKGKKIPLEKGHYRRPSFSSDGKMITYQKITGGWKRSPLWSENPGLYIANVKSGQSTLIHSGGTNPLFADDDTILYFNNWSDGKFSLERIDIKSAS